MEEEMESLERDVKAVEESYGENMLNLTCARKLYQKSFGQRQSRTILDSQLF